MSDTAALTTQPPAPEGRPVLPILVSVEPGEPAAESGSTWNTEFPDGLQSVGTAMHGGVVVASMAASAARATGRRLTAITAHLHSPVGVGAAACDVLELTSGRTATTVRLDLRQDRLRVSATALLTADETGPELPVVVPPVAAGPIPAAPARDGMPAEPPHSRGFFRSLEVVWAGEARPLSGHPEALVQAWMRPRLPVDDTAAAAVMLLDAMAPTLLVLKTEPQVVFTIEYTVHLTPAAHRPFEPGQWFFVRQHTVWAVGDLSVDDAQLWSDAGELIGSARQTRRTMPMPAKAPAR
ncbi:MAG: thioesterase family protein [Microbacteriaceae bacterium]|nr:thioesterase family protein [Microbacteriaceae bacterium]